MEFEGSIKSGAFRRGAAVISQGLLVAAFLSVPVAAGAAVSTDELDQRIKILERQLEIQKEEADAKAKDATTSSFGDKGLSVKKGAFELKLKGLVQLDARTYLDDAAPEVDDTFTFRRIRPSLEGSLGKLVAFRLTPEFAGNGSGDSSSIVDAYIDLKFSPAATLRAGKVKGPVALERLQSGAAISFVERGFPTELAPNRDLGIQLQGELFKSTVSYTLGYYNGTADGRDITGTDSDNRKEVGARLFFEPFKNESGVFQGLGFGVGGTHGTKHQRGNADSPNNFLPRYRTPGQQTFFQYTNTVFADGDHTRISPQAYFYRNAFGLLAEYIRSEQELTTAAATDELENTAWQVATSYVLTGEDASFRGVVKPANAFQVGGPGWGAFELAARYGVLEIDDDAFSVGFASPTASASEATSFGLGVNWYLNANVKIATTYTKTTFDDGAASGDREDEETVFTRLQLSF